MEDIFKETKQKTKTILIRIDLEIANQLKKRNKSYNAALHDMLDLRPERFLIDQVKAHEERLDKIEEVIQKRLSYSG